MGYAAYSSLKADEEERERNVRCFRWGRKKKPRTQFQMLFTSDRRYVMQGNGMCDTETPNHLEHAFVRAGASMA